MLPRGQLCYLRKLFVFLDDCWKPFEDGESILVSLIDFYRNLHLLWEWKNHFPLQIYQCSKETGIYFRIQHSLILPPKSAVNNLVEIKRLNKKIEELQNASKRKKNRFSIQEVKERKRLVKFYTGLQNHGAFMWIYNRIHKKAREIAVFQGRFVFY